MHILILGGTKFLSKRIAVEALAAGHRVTCAARGVSGVAPTGAEFICWDRGQPAPAELAALDPHAVVDVTTTPAFAAAAVALWPQAHWVYISTIDVYADLSRPGTAADTALVAPRENGDPRVNPEDYGGAKVACENHALSAARSLVLRPGLIVGPDDGSGRFAYWPAHAAAAARGDGSLLVPGEPDDPVQIIDVGDLALWVVRALENGLTGCFDAVCVPMPWALFADALAEGVGAALTPVYASSDWLSTNKVIEWVGDHSLPLWIADPTQAGTLARDVASSIEAGLVVRPLADTVRDTLAWLAATPDAKVTGLTREEETALLDRLCDRV